MWTIYMDLSTKIELLAEKINAPHRRMKKLEEDNNL